MFRSLLALTALFVFTSASSAQAGWQPSVWPPRLGDGKPQKRPTNQVPYPATGWLVDTTATAKPQAPRIKMVAIPDPRSPHGIRFIAIPVEPKRKR